MAIRKTTRTYADEETLQGAFRIFVDRMAEYIDETHDGIEHTYRDEAVRNAWYGASIILAILLDVEYIDYPNRLVALFDAQIESNGKQSDGTED